MRRAEVVGRRYLPIWSPYAILTEITEITKGSRLRFSARVE